VVYLYLDKLSNALSRWGRNDADEDLAPDEHGEVKQAAE
jgi:HAE1 family hydrophobic/amphiphilic exporter-1